MKRGKFATLRERRAKTGKSQRAIADACGIAPNHYAVIERGGVASVSLATGCALALALECEPADVLEAIRRAAPREVTT